MKHARIDTEGLVVEVISWNPEGRYHPDVAKAFLPAPDDVAVGWTCADGVFAPPPEPTPEVKLALAKVTKLQEINMGCQVALAALTPTYPERELLTFDKQEAEARAYQENSGANVPLLKALAAARGITVDDLAARVLAKSEAFAVASGALIGQRQRMEDLLDNCESAEAVQAIEVTYSLPGVEEAV